MVAEQILTEEEKFWGPKYGRIYPYLEDATPYKRLLKQVEDFVAPQAGERWLDLGTGSGAIVELLWRKTNGKIGEITALDLADVMLNHLRRKLAVLTLPPRSEQIRLVKHNLARRLPFNNESFDGVVANLVLPYVETHEGCSGREALWAICQEVRRVLKPGGQFVWSSPIHGVRFFKVFLASWRDILRKPRNLFYGPRILRYALQIQAKGKKGVYSFLPEKKLRAMIVGAGFAEPAAAYSFAGQAIVLRTKKR